MEWSFDLPTSKYKWRAGFWWVWHQERSSQSSAWHTKLESGESLNIVRSSSKDSIHCCLPTFCPTCLDYFKAFGITRTSTLPRRGHHTRLRVRSLPSTNRLAVTPYQTIINCCNIPYTKLFQQLKHLTRWTSQTYCTASLPFSTVASSWTRDGFAGLKNNTWLWAHSLTCGR